MDCCVASCTSESEAISSSSRTAKPPIVDAITVPLTVNVSLEKVNRSVSFVIPIRLPSMVKVLSSTIPYPSDGTMLTPPFMVCMDMLPSPIVISSAAIEEGLPHLPAPLPSDIHVCPESPTEEMPYSILLAERIPSSTKSVKLESNV